jgi:hypothetical protein
MGSCSFASSASFVTRILVLGAWVAAAPNGTLTVEHPLADTPDNHALRVREWAEAVWRAWSPHHSQVNAWLDSYL